MFKYVERLFMQAVDFTFKNVERLFLQAIDSLLKKIYKAIFAGYRFYSDPTISARQRDSFRAEEE